MKQLKSVLFIGITSVFMLHCMTSRKIVSTNVAFLYKNEPDFFRPEYRIFHLNDSLSRLYFHFKTTELLYSRKEDGNNFRSKVKLHYRLIRSYRDPTIIDSATTLIVDTEAYNQSKAIIGYVEIKVLIGTRALLIVEATDLYRAPKSVQYLELNKLTAYSDQNFILLDADGQSPLFFNYIRQDQAVVLAVNDRSVKKLFVRYYHRDFPLPGPPFSITTPRPFRYAADSLFELSLQQGHSKALLFSKQGFYHFQSDTLNGNRQGFTLYVFYPGFPDVKTVEQMIASLRYITTKREFENMQNLENPKKALDRFWLNNGVTEERAKELIRQYYGRVLFANRHFTSYLEGWKTDRGMIYIVFGPPNTIYKSSDSENWIYGEESNFMSLNFTFIKADNPFTENDYQMNRSPIFKNSWYRAVDSWRQGRAFSVN